MVVGLKNRINGSISSKNSIVAVVINNLVASRIRYKKYQQFCFGYNISGVKKLCHLRKILKNTIA